jgi:ribosome recycling factor
MNQDQIISEVRDKLHVTLEHFTSELKKLRTGRAHTSTLDGIIVEVYGTKLPLIQVATISVPEAQLLQVTPFDPSNLQSIASAIRDNQSLGLNPVDDGRVIRLPIPSLTSDRRQQIVKQLHEKIESSLISMRNTRHEALKIADKLKKQKLLSEDMYERLEKQIDEQISSQKSDIEKLAKAKETDIITV